MLLKSWLPLMQVMQTLVALHMEQLLIAQLMQDPLETENPGLHWVHMLLGQVVQLGSVQGIMHCPVTVFKVALEQTAQKFG